MPSPPALRIMHLWNDSHPVAAKAREPPLQEHMRLNARGGVGKLTPFLGVGGQG